MAVKIVFLVGIVAASLFVFGAFYFLFVAALFGAAVVIALFVEVDARRIPRRGGRGSTAADASSGR